MNAEEVHRRAAIKKAHNIRIYASPETSFHVSPIAQSDGAPSPRDMWYAQVSLWVQEDLVKAIAQLNDDAAEQQGEKETGVLSMPLEAGKVFFGTGSDTNFTIDLESGERRPGARRGRSRARAAFSRKRAAKSEVLPRLRTTRSSTSSAVGRNSVTSGG